MPVMPYFCFGRFSPPKFCHCNGLPTMQIGLLQQFGGGTLAGACGGSLVYGLLKDIAKGLDFSPVIQHFELFKQFLLQGGGAHLSFGFQRLYAGFTGGDGLLQRSKPLFPCMFHPFVFGFLKLAFAYQDSFFFGSESETGR